MQIIQSCLDLEMRSNSDDVIHEKESLLKNQVSHVPKYGVEKEADYVAPNKAENGTAEASSTAMNSESILIVAFAAMLVFQLGNRIFGRLATFPMHNYPLFMNLLSVFIYIPICYAYIIPMIRYGSQITQQQREIPYYKFAIMGGWDSLAGIMQTFAVNFISNSSTIVLVQQSAIPISMMISKVALDARYTFSQYIGATIVMSGIIVVLIPTLFSSGPSSSTQSNAFELFWIFVLVISCIPMCLSSVYKEKALGEVEIDVIYLNGVVAIFQFAFAIILCIPSASAINIQTNEIIPNIVDGMRCWGGINSIPSDDCAAAPIYVTAYLAFNVVYNILIVVILKHGSANILWMASTVIVPLSNVAFSLDFMPGHRPMTSWDILGLFVIMLGLVLYRFTTQIQSLAKACCGREDSLEEIEEQKKVRLIGMKAESRQTKFVGLNQIEGIQSIFDTRVQKEQKQALYRTPHQIRGNLLMKLGIPPSPQISVTPRTRPGQYSSPAVQLVPTRSGVNPLTTISRNPSGYSNVKNQIRPAEV